jgi:DNA polymerase-1
MESKKFIIIDGNSLLHRAWHALPKLTTKNGLVVNALYGFTLVFLKILKELKPDYITVAFDAKAPTFRHQEFAEYKAKRIKQPDEFYNQIPYVKKLLEVFNVKYLEIFGYEADDIIASVKTKTKDLKTKNIIVSGDLDLLQIVDENTEIYNLKKGISEVKIYDEKTIKEKFGLTPKQLVDFKALKGDPSDNIPGVKGIGEKTAFDLIKKFGSLENLYQNLDKVENKKLRDLLEKNKEQAFFSKKLIAIRDDLEIDLKIEDLKLKLPEKERIVEFFKELEFKSLLPRIDSLFEEKTVQPQKLF